MIIQIEIMPDKEKLAFIAWAEAYWDFRRQEIIDHYLDSDSDYYYFSKQETDIMADQYNKIYTRMFEEKFDVDILESIAVYDPGFMFPVETENLYPDGYDDGTTRVEIR